MTARLRTNKPLIPLETVEQAIAGAADFDGLGDSFMASARANWFVGEPGAVASQLRDFATTHGVDEVMISPIAGAYEAEPMDASPGRVQTLELLAAELGL
jgi:alkanesulfonate monooxygenase SsuD/methylene tetrahydromethanopterin reductase-like flavin-dependent oxidoreductase (luciferase family)